jgi:SAM-dependent methyltransferase
MSAESRWAAAGGADGRTYAAQFAALAATGVDVHGEATLCTKLAPVGAHVLDAGCGTGRVAIRLAELGYRCVGVDSDASMLDTARAASADVTWRLADLLDIDELDETFDLIVAAGNVMPLLAPGTEPVVIDRLAKRLAPGGLLVAGFGLDAAHLPIQKPPFGLAEYDEWCAAAGLVVDTRLATWGGEPYSPDDDSGYAVSIHRNPGESQREIVAHREAVTLAVGKVAAHGLSELVDGPGLSGRREGAIE